jgi:hypothetical protein
MTETRSCLELNMFWFKLKLCGCCVCISDVTSDYFTFMQSKGGLWTGVYICYIYNSERTVCLASKVATNCWRNNCAQCSDWVTLYAHAHRGNLCPPRRQLRVLGGHEGMVHSNLRHCTWHFPSCLLTTRVGLYGYYCPVYRYLLTFTGTILNVCSLFISQFAFSQPTLS